MSSPITGLQGKERKGGLQEYSGKWWLALGLRTISRVQWDEDSPFIISYKGVGITAGTISRYYALGHLAVSMLGLPDVQLCTFFLNVSC